LLIIEILSPSTYEMLSILGKIQLVFMLEYVVAYLGEETCVGIGHFKLIC